MAEHTPPPSMLDEGHVFWRETTRDLLRESVGSLEETAKQMIGVIALLEGLYFHAVTYANLHLDTTKIVIYLLPLVFWLISLLFSLVVFFPRAYLTNTNSWREGKTTFERLVLFKHRALMVAGIFLVLGSIGLLVVLGVYLSDH
jgi:hypothetical protein